MDEVPEQKLYILMVNGSFVSHPLDHIEEGLRGRVVKMNRILLENLIVKMLKECSKNDVGDNFQVFRVR
jgi:hypothetical protein